MKINVFYVPADPQDCVVKPLIGRCSLLAGLDDWTLRSGPWAEVENHAFVAARSEIGAGTVAIGVVGRSERADSRTEYELIEAVEEFDLIEVTVGKALLAQKWPRISWKVT